MTPPAAAAAVTRDAPERLAPPRGRAVPARRRRISGPARAATARSRAAIPASAGERGLAVAALGALEAISRNRALDRLVRGRLSIALVAFALIGIVTLQLGLLRLNTSIGRTLEREALLQRENAALSIEDSEMVAGGRVESQAAHLGMQLVPTGALRFLSAPSHSDLLRAADALRAPVPTTSSAPAQNSSAQSSESSSSTTESANSGGESAGAGSEAASGAATPSGSEAASTAAAASGEQASSGEHAAASAESGSPSGSSSGEASQVAPAGGSQAEPSG